MIFRGQKPFFVLPYYRFRVQVWLDSFLDQLVARSY
jgi:hypothetical protein